MNTDTAYLTAKPTVERKVQEDLRSIQIDIVAVALNPVKYYLIVLLVARFIHFSVSTCIFLLQTGVETLRGNAKLSTNCQIYILHFQGKQQSQQHPRAPLENSKLLVS